jgi:hypothetical protein
MEMRRLVTFVAHEEDVRQLRGLFLDVPSYWTVPAPLTIAQKRAVILRETTEDRILMLDDDLEFIARTEASGEKPKSRMAAPQEIQAAIQGVFTQLNDYAHAGISARQGNNNQSRGWHENGRMMFALGYRPQILRDKCKIGRIETREDIDYTLQLLRQGIANTVTYDYGTGHKKFDAPGGCSDQRTMEQSNADALKLAELHPGLVRVAEREFTFSTKRLEVTCYWKKAFEESQRA